MPNLAETLPQVVRAFGRAVRTGRLEGWALWGDPEALRALERSVAEGAEVPALPRLAALLDRTHLGFAGLERIHLRLESRRRMFIGRPKIQATLLVDRLDLGLRALRLERGLTQAEVAVAAGLKPADLSAAESFERREPPPLESLDRILQALDASYGDLETRTAEPLRVARSLQRRVRKAERRTEPVTLGGRVLPGLVAERLDLALLSLRLQAGFTRPKLAEASGLAPRRIEAIEDPEGGARPSGEELEAVLEALGVEADLIERAARRPLHGIAGLAPARKPWRRGAEPTEPRASAPPAAALRSPVHRRAGRIEAAAEALRKSWRPPRERTVDLQKERSIWRRNGRSGEGAVSEGPRSGPRGSVHPLAGGE